MEQKDKTVSAINLKTYALSESDKIVLMYSNELGLIKAVAKGCKKAKSKLGARMDLLVANSLLISKGRTLYNICEAKTINTFKNLRYDIDKLMFASYISELVSVFGMENDTCSQDIYMMLYCALDKISTCENKIEILIAVMKFQLKFMQITGFGIEFEKCLCCQNEINQSEIYFSALRGGVVCKNCFESCPASVKIHYKIRDFFLALLNTDFNSTNEYEKKATEKVCNVCFNILKQYVQTHCSRQIKSIEILETSCC